MLAILAASALAQLWLPVSSLGDLHHDLSAHRTSAAELQATIAAETRRIGATSAGVHEAQVRLADLQARVDANQTRLSAVQNSLVAARDRLTQLENRLHQATTMLAADLVAGYKDSQPDVMTVIHCPGPAAPQLSNPVESSGEESRPAAASA